MKEILAGKVQELFLHPDTNFLSRLPLEDLRVHRGDNVLETCFQYAVVECRWGQAASGKLLRQIARPRCWEGSHIAGSRIATILGANTSSAYLRRGSERHSKPGWLASRWASVQPRLENSGLTFLLSKPYGTRRCRLLWISSSRPSLTARKSSLAYTGRWACLRYLHSSDPVVTIWWWSVGETPGLSMHRRLTRGISLGRNTIWPAFAICQGITMAKTRILHPEVRLSRV